MGKKSATTLIIFIFAIVIGLILSDLFYFRRADEISNGVDASSLLVAGNQKGFQQIEEKLSANDVYRSLEKFGDWPLKIEPIEKENPFVSAKTNIE
ncbi:hypothetical protein KKC32_04975 [Patescibacteria group bacterium]|nr:hypothetical protein [Patescibacteria group bacterium]